jgi:3-hydroxyacyl-CoA dehydrogenase/enoyl-CoA hydratase/3-hydroxybutyryl-CoA epimerase
MTGKTEADTRTCFEIERRDDGVAVLRLFVGGSECNVIRRDFAERLDDALGEIARDSAIEAVVLTSAKQGSFIVGTDLDLILSLRSASEAAAFSRTGQRALSRIEAFTRPIVAAIDGPCLGAGFELALACRARIASDALETRFGLSDVKLGLCPGLGGTQRLPRLCGLAVAIDLLVSGAELTAAQAEGEGLIDGLVPTPILVDSAAARALSLARAKQKPVRASGHARPRRGVAEILFAENVLGRRLYFQRILRELRKVTGDHELAPERILKVVDLGLSKGFERGISAESEAFGELCVNPTARELVWFRLAVEALAHETLVDDGSVEPHCVTKLGVVGAGRVGGAVALRAAVHAGVPVRLLERDDEALSRALHSMRRSLHAFLPATTQTPRASELTWGRLSPTTEYQGFAAAELVIEAVPEDLELKRHVLVRVERHAHPQCVFATSAAFLPVARLAQEGRYPSRVVGMRFFGMASSAPLVEIVRTERTAPWVIATASAFARRLGAVPIVVEDSRCQYVTRVGVALLHEAACIVTEGREPDVVEAAWRDFGFSMGPRALLAELDLETTEQAHRLLREAFGARFGEQVAFGSLWNGVPSGRAKLAERTAVAQRCVARLVNEVAHCLQDGTVHSARDADVAAVLGLGFPRVRGGPLRYADAVGHPEIVRRLRAYELEHGARFTPPRALIELGLDQGTYHR